MELAEHAIGMLAESSAEQSGHVKFLTIGNKVCCGRGIAERNYQRNLLNGFWPTSLHYLHYRDLLLADQEATAMPVSEEQQDLHERYMHLIELYVGKTWVLEAHALKVPDDVEGNIFQRPDRDYLVPLIAPKHKDGRCLANVEIRVRASGIAETKGVYLRTVDTAGQFAIPWQLEDDCVRVTVPWIKSAALVWLAREEQHGEQMPDSDQLPVRTRKLEGRIMSVILAMDGLIPDGLWDNGRLHFSTVKTTAPLPQVPSRKIKLNGHYVGDLWSKNYRNWRPLTSDLVVQHDDILDYITTENELIIEPANDTDFFAIRNVSLALVLENGRTIQSQQVNQTYSSCRHPRAQGVIGQPIRITLPFPDLETA